MNYHVRSNWFRWIVLIFLVGPSAVISFASENEKVTVTDLSGRKIVGTLKSWSVNNFVVSGETEVTIARQEVRSVLWGNPEKKAPGGNPMIWLANGDRISARPVEMSDDRLTIAWPLLEGNVAPKIALENVIAVIFDLPTTNDERTRLFADIQTLPSGSDLVMLANGDRASGELKLFDSLFVELKVASNSLRLDRSRVRAIRLNPELINQNRVTGPRAKLTLVDGSQITATNLDPTSNSLSFKSGILGNVTLPMKTICACRWFGERIVPLSELEPAKIEFTPFLSAKWSLVRNANVLRGPLCVRGVEYANGLGMHSRMSVTYDLHGNEEFFQSIVGIDDIVNGAGSAVFRVDLDGQPTWTSTEVTGKNAAITTPEIRLKGRKKLTLIVDFGQLSDVSDYADWCDPVLVLDAVR